MSITTTSHKPTHIAQIPEIIAFLGPHLAPPDLFNCVQVCQLWYEIFLPYLYNTLDDSKYSWPVIMSEYDSEETIGNNKDEQWIRAVFAKHGHLVRHFLVSWKVLIDCAYDARTFTRLHSITPTFIGTKLSKRQKLDWKQRLALTKDESTSSFVLRLSQGAQGRLLSPLFAGALTPKSSGNSTVQEQKQDWESMQKLLLLVAHNAGLQRLYLDLTLKNLASVQDLECFYKILSMVPGLTVLENNFLSLALNRVLESAPNLRTLAFAVDTNSNNLFLSKSHPQLRSMTADIFLESATFFTLLRHLPNLDRLSILGFNRQQDFCLDASKILDDTPSRLKVLRLSNQGYNMDQNIAKHVLPWLPNLIEFRIYQLTRTIAQALIRHCPMLEIFEAANEESLHEDYSIDPLETDIVSILLTGCSHLKVFDGIHHAIDAEKISVLPIVCHELTTFRCQIRGVPRLTPAENEAVLTSTATATSVPDPTVLKATLRKQEESRNMQIRVLNRLATLTNLRTLDLGFEYRDLDIFFGHGSMGPRKAAQPDYDFGSPFADTLELSLESGLDCLDTLTKLEVFGFESLDHRIGKAELAWMATHWPRLKLMRGVHEDKKFLRVKRPIDSYKEELRVFMQSLRGDVAHEAFDPFAR
ncbi:hypothetical protein BGZ95_010836 [Linnemannia exigua]|uniref:F-box domain-containing protein n=1 Tax=Linnemannia exigua TaxID=604196 RepID=A0AAD4HBC7_9FUNG|nr:hypothetical protein BGZ95_010836 [Linnemannia exigua]